MFPLGLLLFAPPWGDHVAPALQNFTALVALKMLALSDVHPILEGQVIAIDGNRWRVTEACGGINYFVASLLVGYLYAGLVYRQWGHRLAFVAAAALVPLAANGVRVYSTILLDHYGASRLVSGMEHYLYGVLIFTLVMAVLFITCGRWREDPAPAPAIAGRPAAPPAPGSLVNTVLCGAMAMLLIAIGPASARVLSQRGEAAGTLRQYAAEVSPPWRAAEGDPPGWSTSLAATLLAMRQTHPAAEFHQGYTDGSRSAALYVARYGATQPGVKLVSTLSLPSPWWSARETRRTIELAGTSFPVKEQVLRSPEWSVVVWSCYQIGRSFTANDYAAKLLLGKSRLLRDGEDAATIVIATEELPGVDATAILHGFVARLSISQTASDTSLEPPQPIGLNVLQRSFLSSPSRPANGR
jgi:EpsI family protein